MLPYHEDEVGKSRRVHRTASTRAHDQRELRYHARGQHVELEQKYKKKGKEVVERGGKGVVEADAQGGGSKPVERSRVQGILGAGTPWHPTSALAHRYRAKARA